MQSNSRQIPKKKEICADKQYFDILYGYLQTISYMKNNRCRYFKKKDVNFTKLGQKFNLTRQTISTRFKHLIDIGLVQEFSADEYELIVLDRDYASLIPFNTVEVLVNSLSENCINTYIYLFNRYYANGLSEFEFTIGQIKTFIGISNKTRSNDKTITDILMVLQKLGLIEYELKTKVNEEDSFNNVKTVYKLIKLENTI